MKETILSLISTICILAFTALLIAGCEPPTAPLSSEKAITAFAVTNPAATGVIDEEAKTIAVTVPYGTVVTALVAEFTTTGADVTVGLTAQESGTTPNDFTNPVTYTVTAVDATTLDYTVTVTVALNTAKAITAFSFASPAATGVINEGAKTIAVTVPYGTNVTALVATFTTTGASVKVGSTTQVSGTTANNFTNPVTYTVTAADSSTQDYTVTVTIALNPAKAITAFGFPAYSATGTINETLKTIAVTVPYRTIVTALVATFTTTGASVKVGSTVQVSGTTANNFTNPVTYTVTAADSSTQNYIVTVTIGPNPITSLLKRELVLITGGTYTQTNGTISFDHTVSTFALGKYEVTYDLWYAVRNWAGYNGYSFANAGAEGNDGTAGATPTSARYEPVAMVNWHDAIVWLNAYSDLAGLTPCYTYNSAVIKDSRDTNAAACDNVVCNWAADGYRLPTEGEWHFAATNKGASPWNYASGAAADYTDTVETQKVAWYNVNSGEKTHNVGTTTNGSALSLWDVNGNVWEWCWDWWSTTYPATPQTDYRGPASGTYRCGPGGGWTTVSNIYAGFRNYDAPIDETTNFGFRVAKVNASAQIPFVSVTVSAELASFPRSYAYDGKTSTYWQPSEDDEYSGWIYADLGSSLAVARVALKWEAGCPAFSIEGSNNTVAWTSLVTGLDTSGNYKNTTHDISGTYRYIRISGAGSYGWDSYSLYEFEVYQ
ncbi:MAG: SUMF1/EgtB/PvdO family nonheme iron enzyme [Spirochaetales bacterium]|nr:SUMF1/EgtB/PvdO family nonheme iron enzyme [Spirochaetales bacterium]